MSISRLPSGRWRAQVWDPSVGHNVSAGHVLGERGSYRTKSEARDARDRARARLRAGTSGVTVAQFRDRWITDPLFKRPKRSTMLHNAERTRAFAEHHGGLPIDRVDDQVVAAWLAGGARTGTVPALRAMFNDAASAKAGRLVATNPFAGLGITRGPGNRHRQPPTEQQMWTLVRHARDLTPPSFAAYLEVACFTAIRPGELDALRWAHVRFDDDEIDIVEQYNAKAREFTEPKYGPYTVALVEHARATLLGAPRDSDSPYVFATLRGTHYTPSSRTHHWNRVRAAAGLGTTTLYLATRHYFGWYALNVLDLDPAIVAEQLGHRDGGKLVESLYGHPDRKRRRAKIRAAFATTGQVQPLRAERHEAG